MAKIFGNNQCMYRNGGIMAHRGAMASSSKWRKWRKRQLIGGVINRRQSAA